jgi:hypothetical protein
MSNQSKSQSTKGALLSGLVFPGVGQIALKCFVRGIVFVLAVCAGMVVLVIGGVQQALAILGPLLADDGGIDLDRIAVAAAAAAETPGGAVMRCALLWIVTCWIVATIDAYRIGKQMDVAAAMHSVAGTGHFEPDPGGPDHGTSGPETTVSGESRHPKLGNGKSDSE